MFYLECIKGPMKGEKITLPSKGEFTLGRQEGNDIVLPSQRLSRQHARFYQMGNHLFLRDLDSQNGTFLNNQKVEPAQIETAIEVKPDDKIGIGDFLFKLGSQDHPSDETLAPAQKSLSQSAPPPAEFFLFKSAYEALAQSDSAITFQEAMAELTLKHLGCERLCLMSWNDKKKSLEPALFMNSLARGDAAQFEPSMMVFHTIINEKKTVFTVDAGQDERFQEGESIMGPGVRSIICAPFLKNDHLTGALYLDTLQSDQTLSQEQVPQVESLASLINMGLEHFRG